jgi:polar amino acid transport system substrate-binding protein
MKKMKLAKKMMCFTAATLLTLSMLTGCQKTSEKSAEDTTTTKVASETATTQATATDTTTATSGESALLTAIKEKGYITIGSSNDAPFCYEDVDTKELKGIDIEILREVCKRLGIADIKMKTIDFSNLLVELNNKSVDMVVDGMYVKDERLQIAAFTDKWYQEGEAVVIAKDSTIASAEDLKDKNVGAQPGTTFYDTAQKWLDEGRIGNLTAYDNQATLMTAVNMGKVDAVVTDGIVAGYTLASDSSLNLKLLAPYTAEASGQIGSAVRFEDEAFATEINAVLKEMKDDGTLMKILESYGLTEDYFVSVEDGVTKNVK